MQNSGSVVSWKALWFGLIAGFISSAVGLVILIKTQEDSSSSLISLGSGNMEFTELIIVWLFFLVVGFIAGVVVAFLNKRSGVVDGLMTGLLVMCINLVSLLYLSMIMMLLMFFTTRSDVMYSASYSIWNEMFKMIGNALLVTFPYIIGGLLGGLLSNMFTGGGKDMSMQIGGNMMGDGANNTSTGFIQPSSVDFNDSLPPIVVEKNNAIEGNTQQQSIQTNIPAQSTNNTQPIVESPENQQNNTLGNK